MKTISFCNLPRSARRAALPVLWWLLAITGLEASAQTSAPEPTILEELRWAYASMSPMPSFVEDGKKYMLPGTPRSYARSDTLSFYAPADWYPDDHPNMPPIVARGREKAGIWACAMCHYPNGQGRPENAGVAGLDKGYIVQQLLDFKNGRRRSTDTSKTNTHYMVAFAASMTVQEIEQSASYFSAMPWRSWIRVVETDIVPKTHVEGGVHLPLEADAAGTEPIGKRIIEVPQDVYATEVVRNPRVGWVAYVPQGAIARGQALVHGSKTAACTVCHGAALDGLAVVPALRGRSPSYIARQMGDFKSGARNGVWAPLMSPVAANLTAEDILNISAYLASLPPRL